jgi:rare lipoprotein A (peptidoglycan hydrolase)
MTVQVKFTSGPAAVAEVASDPATGTYALRLRLDPGTLVITAPKRTNGPRELAAFLAKVAKEAGLLAVVLDPTESRHALTDERNQEAQAGLADWYGESGAGRRIPEMPR